MKLFTQLVVAVRLVGSAHGAAPLPLRVRVPPLPAAGHPARSPTSAANLAKPHALNHSELGHKLGSRSQPAAPLAPARPRPPATCRRAPRAFPHLSCQFGEAHALNHSELGHRLGSRSQPLGIRSQAGPARVAQAAQLLTSRLGV